MKKTKDGKTKEEQTKEEKTNKDKTKDEKSTKRKLDLDKELESAAAEFDRGTEKKSGKERASKQESKSGKKEYKEKGGSEVEKTVKGNKRKDEPIKFYPSKKDKISHIFDTPDKKTKAQSSPAETTATSTSRQRAEERLRELAGTILPSDFDDDSDSCPASDLEEIMGMEDGVEDDASSTSSVSESSAEEGEGGEEGKGDGEQQAESKDEEDDLDSEDEESEEGSEPADSEEGEGSEESGSEVEDAKEEAKEVAKEKSDVKDKNKENQHALAPLTSETQKQVAVMRNSMSNKKDYDNFCRQAKTKMPAQLNELYLAKKQEVFNMWLDCGMDWDRCCMEAERKHQQRNVAMRGWRAMQGKELKKLYSEEKYKALITKRKEQGLFYEDDEFKNDDEDDPMYCWERLDHS